jgi:hypothetical protein
MLKGDATGCSASVSISTAGFQERLSSFRWYCVEVKQTHFNDGNTSSLSISSSCAQTQTLTGAWDWALFWKIRPFALII